MHSGTHIGGFSGPRRSCWRAPGPGPAGARRASRDGSSAIFRSGAARPVVQGVSAQGGPARGVLAGDCPPGQGSGGWFGGAKPAGRTRPGGVSRAPGGKSAKTPISRPGTAGPGPGLYRRIALSPGYRAAQGAPGPDAGRGRYGLLKLVNRP